MVEKRLVKPLIFGLIFGLLFGISVFGAYSYGAQTNSVGPIDVNKYSWEQGKQAGFNEGFLAGQQAGNATGWADGYNAGFNDATANNGFPPL